jgi:rubrerythrin
MSEVRIDENLDAILKILNKGIAMERNAKSFYLSAAGKVNSVAGKNMLKWLADFESGHEVRLKARKDDLIERMKRTGQSDKEMGKYELSEISDSKTVTPDMSEIDILKFAIASEKKAYTFFQHKISSTVEPSLSALFKELAAEEDDHIRIVTEQLEHLKKTQIWMDVNEFEDYMKRHHK